MKPKIRATKSVAFIVFTNERENYNVRIHTQDVRISLHLNLTRYKTHLTMLPTIHVRLRKDKKRGDKCAIILQVYHNKKQRQYFTGLFIEEKFFSEGAISNKLPNATWYRQMIKNKINDLEQEFLKQSLDTGNVEITNKKLRATKKGFFDYAYTYYRGMQNRNSKAYIDRSVASIKNFEAFAGSVSFQSITPQLLKKYEDHLFAEGKQRNTVNRIFKRIKQVFTQAVREGITGASPFNIFRTVTYKQPKRNYLTMEEIKQIEDVELLPELDLVRNYFLLSCYTGLRFSDVQKFDKNKAIITNKGVQRIIIGTTKTDEVVSIKLTENVKRIIDRINKPLPSNVHTNRLLKIIGEAAEVSTPLHYHLSRHAAAVNMASAGLPIEIVGRILGHTSIRTTAIYFKITDSKLDEAIDKFEKFRSG